MHQTGETRTLDLNFKPWTKKAHGRHIGRSIGHSIKKDEFRGKLIGTSDRNSRHNTASAASNATCFSPSPHLILISVVDSVCLVYTARALHILLCTSYCLLNCLPAEIVLTDSDLPCQITIIVLYTTSEIFSEALYVSWRVICLTSAKQSSDNILTLPRSTEAVFEVPTLIVVPTR